jgi:hypothetical protein
MSSSVARIARVFAVRLPAGIAVVGASACGSAATTAAHDAATDGTPADAVCAATHACTGSVSGDLTGPLTSCTASSETGLPLGFGEVTLHFAFTDATSGALATGSGNVSTTGMFAPGTYAVDAGLWNDTGSSGTAADSLWTVGWSGDGRATMTQCNGIASPDAIPSVCVNSSLQVRSVDACGAIHGTLSLTVPSYMGSATVGIALEL